MDDNEVKRQIDQMVRFIKQEAEEKANEISVAAEEDFNLEKLQLLEAEKTRIKQEYERKESQIDVKKKIDYSKQLNASRIKVLQAQEDAVQAVVKEAHNQLIKAGKDAKSYKSLLTDLLVQALYKLGQSEAVVKVRKTDLSLVKEVIGPAKDKFKKVYGADAPSITFDEKNFLPPAPSGDQSHDHDSCLGGVTVTSKDGKIVCANTLDDRLQIAYQASLPDIRTILFGAITRA